MIGDRRKARYDREAKTAIFQEGQPVLLYNLQWKKGLSLKLQTIWDGPYKIIKRLNDDTGYRMLSAPEQNAGRAHRATG